MGNKGRWNEYLWISFLGLLLTSLPVWGVTPMEYYNTIVAGRDDAGFRDGSFTQAQFDHPTGLALDVKGQRLFVADRDNNRIRVVYLNEENRVESLAGTGQIGQVDGPLDKATFNQPAALVWLPPDRLAVYDGGNRVIRLVDLVSKAVTTLKSDSPDGKIGWVWNLVYRQTDDSLYLTQPDDQRLIKWDFKAQKWVTVFLQDPKVPHPMAMCLGGDNLFVADRDLPTVFGVEKSGTTTTAMASLKEAGTGQRIMELAATDGLVYAIQAGATPLARVVPEYKPVTLTSAWGFFLTNDNEGMEPFLTFDSSGPLGFAASPVEKRKLFIAQPKGNVQSIVSVKDYDFGDRWQARANTDQPLTDFDYPKEKPPGTFRILVAGNSRVVTSPVVNPNGKVAGEDTEYRVQTFPKQLEFLLNAQSALQGAGTRYEVLVSGHPGKAVQFFTYYEVPPLVKDYDVDLVLLFTTGDEPFSDYYNRQITNEGIPAHEDDPELLLKPISKRPTSDVAKRFYNLCMQKGWATQSSPTGTSFSYFGEILKSENPDARNDLLEMMGKSLGLLSSKLRGLKTNEGVPVKFLLCLAPPGFSGQEGAKVETYESFWKDICSQQQWPLLDMTDSYDAFQAAFYPPDQQCCHHHFTTYGNGLLAYLLNYYLKQDKWVPFPQPTPANPPK